MISIKNGNGKHVAEFFLTFPFPRAFPKFCLLGGMARNIYSYMETLNLPNNCDWLHFYTYHLMPERKKHLDVAGIKPGPCA